MEQLREPSTHTAPPQPAAGPVTTAATDVARRAGEARANADAVPRDAATVTVTVKTTGSRGATVVATPDTTMAEIMTHACRDLGVPGGGQYLLVTDGQVIADGGRTLRDVVGDKLGTTLDARVVKKPEAGAPVSCPS